MQHSLLSKTLLAFAALTLAATSVHAQPSSVEPAPAATTHAPQTHDWNDVSHINGRLVPVGESNDYVKKFRKTNISSNPLGWILGFYSVSASFAISNHVAIRGDFNYIAPIESDETMTEVGIGAPLYLRRTYQGPFVEPGLIVRSAERGEGADTIGPQILLGWHRTWDSGFNIAAAAGLGRNVDANRYCDGGYCYDDRDSVFFNGYFRVGYAF